MSRFGGPVPAANFAFWKSLSRRRQAGRSQRLDAGQQEPPTPRGRLSLSVLTPVRWAAIFGIVATLRVSFELNMNRPGILAAVTVYAAITVLQIGRASCRERV